MLGASTPKDPLKKIQNLKKLHKLSMIAILEHSSNNSNLHSYKIQFNMDKEHFYQNGKIWLFWTADYVCNIMETDDQHITCDI